MPKFRMKQPVVEAVQWFPGVEHPAVMGNNPEMWCGCVMIGGPCNVPHIHIEGQGLQTVLVEPGDWIIADGEHYHVCAADAFDLYYEAVS